MIAFRRLVFFYQLLLACGGLALAILSLTMLLNSPMLAVTPREILVGGLVLGILVVLVTALGAFGTIKEHNKPALLGYMILILALIGVTITGVAVLGSSLKEDRLLGTLGNIWDSVDNTTALQIESWGQCCGFLNYSDRIQEPCTRYQEEVGCYQVMRVLYESKLAMIVVPLTVLLLGECVGLIFNMILLWLSWRETYQSKMIGDRQPFDAWHKAVFQ